MNQNTCCPPKDASCPPAISCCTPQTSTSQISETTTVLNFIDMFGAFKARWGIGRDNYRIEPGLYSVGNPNSHSPILVSANYKLTFDTLRKNLPGLDCFLLILDTKGVNVWCAAGKGTFGTDELVNRIELTGLKDIVENRTLILPQLGATGVSAHEVKSLTGFTVIYGPVRAKDIKEYLSKDCKATEDMRTVKFTMCDRTVLTPMAFLEAARISLFVFGVLFLLNLFVARPFGFPDFLAYTSSILAGTVITPILLPFIPGRSFAFKGWLMGAIVTAYISYTYSWFTSPLLLLGIGYMLALPAHSAFLAINFTGASTYTSFSGVIKEMKIAVPAIIFSVIVGVIFILTVTII